MAINTNERKALVLTSLNKKSPNKLSLILLEHVNRRLQKNANEWSEVCFYHGNSKSASWCNVYDAVGSVREYISDYEEEDNNDNDNSSNSGNTENDNTRDGEGLLEKLSQIKNLMSGLKESSYLDVLWISNSPLNDPEQNPILFNFLYRLRLSCQTRIILAGPNKKFFSSSSMQSWLALLQAESLALDDDDDDEDDNHDIDNDDSSKERALDTNPIEHENKENNYNASHHDMITSPKIERRLEDRMIFGKNVLWRGHFYLDASKEKMALENVTLVCLDDAYDCLSLMASSTSSFQLYEKCNLKSVPRFLLESQFKLLFLNEDRFLSNWEDDGMAYLCREIQDNENESDDGVVLLIYKAEDGVRACNFLSNSQRQAVWDKIRPLCDLDMTISDEGYADVLLQERNLLDHDSIENDIILEKPKVLGLVQQYKDKENNQVLSNSSDYNNVVAVKTSRGKRMMILSSSSEDPKPQLFKTTTQPQPVKSKPQIFKSNSQPATRNKQHLRQSRSSKPPNPATKKKTNAKIDPKSQRPKSITEINTMNLKTRIRSELKNSITRGEGPALEEFKDVYKRLFDCCFAMIRGFRTEEISEEKIKLTVLKYLPDVL